MDSKIKSIKARKILDSRGNWTIEVDLETPQGLFRDSAPSGASKGKYEAKTVAIETAVKNVNKIVSQKLKGKNVTDQKGIDKTLKKLNIGANATTAISMALCRAGAAAQDLPLWKHIHDITFPTAVKNVIPLPKPCFNIINGGVHAGNELDFQEFMIVPQERVFSKSLKMATEIYQSLKRIIKEKYMDLAINVGDEGGFAPPVRAPEEAIELILEAAKKLGHQERIKIILDIAASQFFNGRNYKMKIGTFTREGLLNYYSDLIKKYPILGLEDPFAETDFEGWQKFKPGILVIGDDLLVTNPERIKMAKDKNACNAAIIKVNQIGTVSEALEAAKLAKSYGWKVIVSHRAGDTCDDFIADLAVGIGGDFIKAGAPARGERIAKYNRLLRIEGESGYQ